MLSPNQTKWALPQTKGQLNITSSCRISVLWIHTVAFCSHMPCVCVCVCVHRACILSLELFFFLQCFAYCIDWKVYKRLNQELHFNFFLHKDAHFYFGNVRLVDGAQRKGPSGTSVSLIFTSFIKPKILFTYCFHYYCWTCWMFCLKTVRKKMFVLLFF